LCFGLSGIVGMGLSQVLKIPLSRGISTQLTDLLEVIRGRIGTMTILPWFVERVEKKPCVEARDQQGLKHPKICSLLLPRSETLNQSTIYLIIFIYMNNSGINLHFSEYLNLFSTKNYCVWYNLNMAKHNVHSDRQNYSDENRTLTISIYVLTYSKRCLNIYMN
jgi:hypothetical protein